MIVYGFPGCQSEIGQTSRRVLARLRNPLTTFSTWRDSDHHAHTANQPNGPRYDLARHASATAPLSDLPIGRWPTGAR